MTPTRNTDLRHIDSGLPAAERAELARVARIRQQVLALGERYLLSPANAPVKGTYHPRTGRRLP